MPRTIVIRIVVDNRDAVNAAKAQTEVLKQLQMQVAANNDEMRKNELQTARMQQAHTQATQAHNNLTASFIKGFLAARALSEVYSLVTNSVGSLVSSLVELDLNFAKVQAVTGSSKADIAGLKDVVFALGRNTAASTVEISSAALELAKLGFEGKNLEIALTGVARLSSVLGDSLESTGNLVGAVIQTFDLSAEQAATVADKLFIATGKSATNIQGFRTSFNYAGAAAQNAGVSFEELSTVLAILSNNGIRASTAGSGLRTVFTNLSIEGSKAEKALGGGLEELGLLGVMNKLAKLKGDQGTLIDIFSKPALPVVLNLANMADAFKKLLPEIQNANGELDKSGKIINDTLSGSFTQLTNSIVEFANVFTEGPGHILVDIFHGMATDIQSITDGLKQMNSVMALMNNPDAFKSMGLNAKVEGGRVVGSSYDEVAKAVARNKEVDKYDIRNTPDVENALFPPAKTDNSLVKKAKDDSKELLNNIQKVREAFQEYKEGGLDPFSFSSSEKELEKIRDHFKQIGDFKKANQAESLIAQLKGFEGIDAKAGFAKNRAAYDEDRNLAKAKKRDITTSVNDSPDERTQFLMDKQEELDNFNRKLEATKLLFTEMDKSFQTLSSTMVDSIFAWEFSWTHFGYVVKDIFKGLVKDFIAMEIRILALRAALGFATFLGGALFAPALPAGAAAAGGNLQGAESILGPTGAALSASGYDGIVNSPKMFIAGEAGAERVRISPLAKSSAGSKDSGGGVTIVVQGDVYNAEKLIDMVALTKDKSKTRYV